MQQKREVKDEANDCDKNEREKNKCVIICR